MEPEVWIRREEYRNGIQAAEADAAQTNQRDLPAEDEAIAQADALMEALGLTNMVCDDVQPAYGTLMLRYVPTVDGFPLPSIREDYYTMDGYHGYQYWAYSASEETNPDTVSWHMESIQIYVDEEGICCFRWESPTSEPSVKAEQSALLPFEEIAAIADATLPLVVTGPTEGSSLVEVDRINGEETFLDVEITQVSLTLMRIRDKGSLQGTIVPVWDFWGTREWYDDDQEKVGSQIDYSVQPLLTLNAVDGSVVSRLLGY